MNSSFSSNHPGAIYPIIQIVLVHIAHSQCTIAVAARPSVNHYFDAQTIVNNIQYLLMVVNNICIKYNLKS